MFKKIYKQHKIIFLTLSIIVLLGLIVGGYYYWWTGTPEYSVYQIRKATETHNKELGLKYVDTNSIFKNLWGDVKSKAIKKAQGAEGAEALGTMLGLQLIESMKPVIKDKVDKRIESWFSTSTKSTNLQPKLKGNFEITEQENSAYIELPNNLKIILTEKSGERYWVITEIKGLLDAPLEDIR